MKRLKRVMSILLTIALIVTGVNLQVPVAKAAVIVSNDNDLYNAISAGGNVDISLSANIVGNSFLDIQSGSNIIIHMNGHNITLNMSEYGFFIESGATLQLVGPGTITNLDAYDCIYNSGNLVVDGATLITNGYTAVTNYGGTVTLNSGVIGSSVCENGIYNDISSSSNTVIVNGGTIQGKTLGISLNSGNAFTFTRGTIIGGTNAIAYYDGSMSSEISDATLKAFIGASSMSKLTINTTTEKSIVDAVPPSVTTTTADFNKNASADAAITVALGVGSLGASGIASVKNDTATLISDTDYTFSGTTLTIKKEYLENQTPGTTTLTVAFNDAVTTTGTVGITVAASTAKAITAFSIGSYNGTIDESGHTIAVKLPAGTDVNSVTPNITISRFATVSPAIGASTNFSTSPVTYTVTAEDGVSTQAYAVTVTVMENVNINAGAATGLTYDGTAKNGYAASPTVTKTIGSTDVTSSVTLTYTYYTGTELIPANLLASAPTAAGTYTLVISLVDTGTNYIAVPKTLTFSIAKTTPAIAVLDFPVASGITYGAALSTATLTGGKAKNGSTEVAGSFQWINGTTIPTVSNTGYDVVFVPADTANYNNSTQITVPIVVSKSIPGIPASPVLNSRTVNSITIKPITVEGYTVEYSYITGSETLATLDERWQEAVTFTGLNSKTSYNFYSRIKVGDNNLASLLGSPTAVYTLQTAPAASAVTIDYINETVTFDDVTYEVNTTEDFSGSAVAKGGSIKGIINNTTDSAIYVRGKALGALPAGIATEVTLPARQSSPGTSEVVLDYASETITYPVGIDVKQAIDLSGSSVVNGSITGLIPDSSGSDATLYAYRLATVSAFQSVNLNIIILKRPSFSTLPSSTELNRTDTCITLNTILGTEYRIKIDGIFTAWTNSTVFSGLTPNKEYTFETRLKATDTSFASAATTSNITTKKTLPTITTTPTATGVYGTVLSGMSLQSGVAKIEDTVITGTWEWTEVNKDTITPIVGTTTSYTAKFTPDASHSGIYDTAQFTVVPTVTKRALIITDTTATSRTYNGSKTVAVTGVLVSNKVGSDVIVITATGTLSSEDAGTYTLINLTDLVLSGTNSGNYSLATSKENVTTDVTIGKATSIVTMTSNKTGDSSIYGEAVTFTAIVSGGSIKPKGSIQFTLDGSAFGDPVILINGTASLTTNNTQLTTGSKNIAAQYIPSVDEINYNSSISSNCIFTVNKKIVTVKAIDKSIYAGDAIPENSTLTCAVTGLISGDILITTPTLSLDSSAVSTIVGTFTITVTGAVAGDNYTVNMVNGNLYITAKPPVPSISTPISTPTPTPVVETVDIIGTDERTFATISRTVAENKINVTVDVPTDEIMKEAAENATEEQPLNIIIPISSQNLVEQIAGEEVQKVNIEVTIPSAILTNHNIDVTDIKMDSEILEAAKKAEKDVTISVANEEGREQYSWTFTGSNLSTSDNKIADVNLSLKVERASDNADYKELLKNDANNAATENTYGLVVNFSHVGDLPSQASVKIYVGNLVGTASGLSENNKVYLYYYNSTTDKLETLPYSSAYQVDKDGYITINILHCSEYIILPKQADNSIITTLRSQIKVTLTKKTLQVGKTSTIKVNLPQTLELVNKLTDKTSSSAAGAATVSFVSSNKAVATVNSAGRITAKRTGTVTIATTVKLYSGKNKTVNIRIFIK